MPVLMMTPGVSLKAMSPSLISITVSIYGLLAKSPLIHGLIQQIETFLDSIFSIRRCHLATIPKSPQQKSSLLSPSVPRAHDDPRGLLKGHVSLPDISHRVHIRPPGQLPLIHGLVQHVEPGDDAAPHGPHPQAHHVPEFPPHVHDPAVEVGAQFVAVAQHREREPRPRRELIRVTG